MILYAIHDIYEISPYVTRFHHFQQRTRCVTNTSLYDLLEEYSDLYEWWILVN